MVYNGVLYTANVKRVVAIDIGTGRQLWNYDIEWAPEVAACSVLRPEQQGRRAV